MKLSLARTTAHGAVWAVSAILIATALGVGTALAAGPKPGDDGIAYCNLIDSSSGEGVTVDVASNSCCYEEPVEGEDTLTVCIKCDKYWYNCKEVWADGSSRPGISLPSAGGGTINETRPGKATLPSLKLK